MKLYYSPFACSLAAHITCREAGLDVELARVELARVEIAEGRFVESGMVSRYIARFHEILDGHRIVTAYEMRLNERLHSLSLATVEMSEVEGGTRLLYTEQIVFLDGTTAEAGTRSRETGTVGLFDRLDASLDAA